MTRLRLPALILLAALRGAAWAACNPVGTEDCCTKVVTEECTSADWPLPGDIETSLTEDGRPRFILTGMPDSARYYGIRHETWIPVEPRITCPPDRETPIEGDIRTFVSWEMTTNDVVVATGFNTEAVVPDGISGLVRCDFEVHSFAGVCDEHSTGYTRSATVVRLEVTGGIVPRHSTNPEGWPELECYVTAKGSENTPVSVTLTGSKIRFEPGHLTTKTILVSGDSSFKISGQDYSETMADASVIATVQTDFGSVSTNADVTVVWVEPIILRSDPAETISAENTAVVMPSPTTLGTGIVSNTVVEGRYMSNVVEIRGLVHPVGFKQHIHFCRDVIDEYSVDFPTGGDPVVVQLSTNQPQGEVGDGTDHIFEVLCSTKPSDAGFIYDIDTPGLPLGYTLNAHLQNGAMLYRWYNFLEYAYMNLFGSPVRVSDNFAWYSKTTVLVSPGTNNQATTTARFDPKRNDPNSNFAAPGRTDMPTLQEQ